MFYLVFMRCQRTTVSDLTMVMVSRMRDSDDKQNEQGTVGPTQMQSTWCSLLQSIELMPQYQYFGLQPPVADLKQSYSKRTKRKAIAIIRRSCSDSLLNRETNGLNFRKRQGDIYAANAHRDRKVGDY